MSSDLDLIDRGTIDFSGIDKELFETTDLGKFGEYRGEMVPLDLPIKNMVINTNFYSHNDNTQ